MSKRVGVTASRAGLSASQAEVAAQLLRQLYEQGYRILHHGDCAGGDVELHELAASLGFKVELHPPSDPKLRSFSDDSQLNPGLARSVIFVNDPLPYLERNGAVVDSTHVLLAFPSGREEDQPRSGTWATVRYARRHGRPVRVVSP